MKKQIYIMAICVVGFFTLCTVAYYQSYKKAVNDREDIEYRTREPESDRSNVAASSDGQRISAKCEMTTINHEVSDDSQETIITKINPKYVGMTMQELTEQLKEESEKPVLEEINRGFIRAELVSFEAKKIVIKRYYSKNDIPDKYFMKLEKNYITIYYADHETVFENTGITEEQLREEEIIELKKGIDVKDEHTLFSILEGYTS